ncbi:UNVERIFIED_CONTAM: Retrovirus-related Pol polyprotein from type-2 retrotransposable element R2DM [Sesamum calycinum]|uniref:Retrovirus-related Pol polyprotein from type-2 retrotransposable element R2DM n=1 Tax=Sesamum calycinum TaxID=2727403 RepID=A0AAW2SUV4_9LAMI
MFVNDRWFGRWRNVSYVSLTPRTSNHSPLVIRGDTQTRQVTNETQGRPFHEKLAATFLESAQQQKAKMQWMKGGDQCSRVFFCKIAARRASKLVFQIMDDEGTTHTEPTEVISEFTGFYQQVLGGKKTDRFLDLRFLRPWARYIITKEGFQYSPHASYCFGGECYSVCPYSKAPSKEKVDLRKAYDTLEWGFLLVVLRLFGFPDPFVQWIEECITTPAFSFCINGAAQSFFRGARGLRQGDPMSPYLFVLVIEVLRVLLQQLIDQDLGFSFHWRCRESGLFQLCFADDLLLFYKADVSSVSIFKRGLESFASISGLYANPTKSHLIIS